MLLNFLLEITQPLLQTYFKLTPNVLQTYSKLTPNLLKTDSKITQTLLETGSKLTQNLHQASPKLTSNLLQTYSKTLPNISHSYSELTENLVLVVKTPTQLQRNLNPTAVGGWTRKWLCKPHPPPYTNSMSIIFQLSLTRFWPNFKDRFLGLSWTYSNCHSDICPGNICQGDICAYQEYLSCYWPDFDQTLKVGSWDHFEQI